MRGQRPPLPAVHVRDRRGVPAEAPGSPARPPAQEPGGVEVSEPRKKHSVQNLTHELHGHVITLTKAGAFKGHQAARTIFDYYCQNIAANDDKGRDFVRGEVMPSCSVPAVVAKSTGLTTEGVRQANAWLHAQRFISMGKVQASHQRSIAVMTTDPATEELRLKELDANGPAASPLLKPGRPARVIRHGSPTAGNPNSVGITANSVGVSKPETQTQLGHTSSDLPSANQLLHPESATPTGLDELNQKKKREEGGAARPPEVPRERPAPEEEYDNTFWYGLSKDRTPYFTRTSMRERIESDEGQMPFTPEQAIRFFQRQKSDPAAWLAYRWELYNAREREALAATKVERERAAAERKQAAAAIAVEAVRREALSKDPARRAWNKAVDAGLITFTEDGPDGRPVWHFDGQALGVGSEAAARLRDEPELLARVEAALGTDPAPRSATATTALTRSRTVRRPARVAAGE
jgi:hypothetical protein